MQSMYTIPNLQSHLVELKKPWNHKQKLPEFKNAVDYKRWATLPNTKHLAFSTFEGVDPTQRVSEGNNNEARRIHGVVADYDARLTDSEFEEFMRRVIDMEYS